MAFKCWKKISGKGLASGRSISTWGNNHTGKVVDIRKRGGLFSTSVATKKGGSFVKIIAISLENRKGTVEHPLTINYGRNKAVEFAEAYMRKHNRC